MRIAVYHDGKIVVTVPKLSYNNEFEKKYIVNKSKWIDSKLAFYNNLRKDNNLDFKNINFKDYKDKAFSLVETKLKYLQTKYKYRYNSVSIKNQKTIWGSCSRKNKLSFNFKIALLKPKIREYVIVHEFCHLKMKDHSRKFWLLVEKMIPDYKEIKEKMIRYDLGIF